MSQRGDIIDTNPPVTCAVCGKPARVHVCEIRDGKKTNHSYCDEHSGDHVPTHFHAEANAMAGFPHDDPESAKKIRAMFSPGQIDQSVRQAIQLCWMMLPDDAKTVDELEK